MLDHQLRILGFDVHARAYCAPADPQIAQVIGGLDDPLQSATQRLRICVQLLAESDRHRILQMGASRFQNVVELLALFFERTDQPFERPLEYTKLGQTCEADRRRNHVVGRLRHVDVIVWMDG